MQYCVNSDGTIVGDAPFNLYMNLDSANPERYSIENALSAQGYW